ncbi:MAG: MgtC/SapB family protein [Patescibacteria group bacterium]
MTLLTPENYIIFFKLFLALLLGITLGIERAMAHKTAGMRTFGLVCMGACLFVIISELMASQHVNQSSFDPLRMASQIIVGIGFLGAGLIIVKGPEIVGLTTAAGLWVTAGIGMAVGFGLYAIAIFATLITLFAFVALWAIEEKIKGQNI